MSDLAPHIRQARLSDAEDLARIYVESWQDTYAALLPHALLAGMSAESQAAHWRHVLKAAGAVLLADSRHGPIGLASMGVARDPGMGFDGEVYTLYVDPAFLGRGIGRGLLDGAFAELKDRGFQSCVIWSHAGNNACFFYEAMGGRRVASRTTRMGGAATPEVAFGWRRLASSARRPAF